MIKEDYERIRKSLSAVFLGKRSIKEWPEIFTDQWLGRMPELALCEVRLNCDPSSRARMS